MEYHFHYRPYLYPDACCAAGLVFALLYLFLGYSQRERAEDYILSIADERGHKVGRVLVHPSIGNLLVWRSVYEADGMYYADAVRVGPLSGPMVYEGGSIEKFDVENTYPGLGKDTVIYKDIQRFKRFSNGFLVVYPEYPNIIGDLRYSILPNGVKPLWGIEIDLENENEHIEMADYERTVSGDDWSTFLDMLLERQTD
jgi:inner membrane protein